MNKLLLFFFIYFFKKKVRYGYEFIKLSDDMHGNQAHLIPLSAT